MYIFIYFIINSPGHGTFSLHICVLVSRLQYIFEHSFCFNKLLQSRLFDCVPAEPELGIQEREHVFQEPQFVHEIFSVGDETYI